MQIPIMAIGVKKSDRVIPDVLEFIIAGYCCPSYMCKNIVLIKKVNIITFFDICILIFKIV